MLSGEFAKVFERKVYRVQVAHLHNAACALSSPSRCFQLSTNLDKDFCHYLWYCGKKQIECRLAWHWWNSTDLGLTDRFYAEIVVCLLLFRKSPHKPNLESTSKYGFPPIWGENGGVLSTRIQVILHSLFARPGSALIWGGKKGEFRELDYLLLRIYWQMTKRYLLTQEKTKSYHNRHFKASSNETFEFLTWAIFTENAIHMPFRKFC